MREINKINNNGLQQGLWKVELYDGSKHIFHFEDGTLEGPAIRYIPNIRPLLFKMFKNNISHGVEIIFEPLQGGVVSVGMNKNGAQKGLWYEKNK